MQLNRASLAESESMVESLRQSTTPQLTLSSQFASSFTESMFLASEDPDEHVHQLLHEAKLDVDRMRTRWIFVASGDVDCVMGITTKR